MNAIQHAFLPISRRGHAVPPAHRRSAVLLARRIGNKQAAWLFGVSAKTVGRWKQQQEEQAR